MSGDIGQRKEGEKKSVLFICTHNSARSQMAEGLVNHLFSYRYIARSAGTKPAGVNPLAVKAMAEIGIDISRKRSKSLKEFEGQEFDLVVTLCSEAEEACPFFPGKEHMHQGFEDPSAATGDEEQKLQAFRRVRDAIKAWAEATFKA
ncbi:MAG: arsenate reductase ArsC [Methanomassiliicoccales archaeon]